MAWEPWLPLLEFAFGYRDEEKRWSILSNLGGSLSLKIRRLEFGGWIAFFVMLFCFLIAQERRWSELLTDFELSFLAYFYSFFIASLLISWLVYPLTGIVFLIWESPMRTSDSLICHCLYRYQRNGWIFVISSAMLWGFFAPLF